MTNVLVERAEELSAIFQNEKFKLEAEKLITVEDMQSLFAKYNVQLTLEEVKELCRQIGRYMQNAKDGELEEDTLELVSGGIAWGMIALGAVCVGAFALGVYNAL